MRYILRRTTAYFIDCIICFSAVMLVIQWLLLSNIRPYLGITDDWFRDSLNMEIYVLLTISIPVWLYFSYLDTSRAGGTFGKRWLGLKLVSADGEPLGFIKVLGRTILKLLPWEIAHLGVIFPTPLYYEEHGDVRLLSYIGIALFVIYFLSILQDRKNRSLYDRICHTELVNR